MLHPSYSDLMQVINEDAKDGEPIVSSRYSIVMAASKRARQLIAAGEPGDWENGLKPLSVAVEEIADSRIKILRSGTSAESTEDEGTPDPSAADGSEGSSPESEAHISLDASAEAEGQKDPSRDKEDDTDGSGSDDEAVLDAGASDPNKDAKASGDLEADGPDARSSSFTGSGMTPVPAALAAELAGAEASDF